MPVLVLGGSCFWTGIREFFASFSCSVSHVEVGLVSGETYKSLWLSGNLRRRAYQFVLTPALLCPSIANAQPQLSLKMDRNHGNDPNSSSFP